MKNIGKLGLGLCILLLAVGQWACSAFGSAQPDPPAPKYPPYPNVWDWVVPRGTEFERAISVEKQETGEVVVTYAVKNPNVQPGQPGCQPGIVGCLSFHGVTFFSRERAEPPLTGLHGDRTIHLKNGLTLERIGRLGGRAGGCYDRLNAIILKKDRTGNIVQRTKLLYALDPPQRYLTRDDCYDGPPFLNRVDSVFPDFLALEDDTFLTIDHEHGVIVRLDAEFRSQSALLNRRVFVVDENMFNDWVRKMNYGSREEGTINLQIQQDGLYRLLMEIRGRTQP